MGKRIIFVGLNAYICLNFLNLEPMKKFFSGILCLFLLSSYVNAQNQACADSSAFYTFQYNAKNYTIVKDGKNWADALLCAYELGGHLAIIDSQEEQDAIWAEIQNANIINSNTIAPDGGNASYLWIGGNDLTEEGNWVWIDENGSTTQFWQGISTGNSVDGLYNNWGDEPDDYLGQQDGLGLALTDWPLGYAGEWNDINVANSLYFIVESEIDTTSEGGSGGENELCTDSTALFYFQYDNKSYAIAKEAKNWADALACAYEFGGSLAKIDSQEEQDAIWTGIQNANITNSNTVAPDGGNASYLWIGGNDLVEEGNWVWIDENGSTTQFWQGISTGNSVDGLYNNWGDEPDDYLGQQDGLGLALTDWPLGFAGEWNDLNVANLLYYIIEFEGDSASEDSVIAIASHSLLLSTIYPNPSSSYFKISGNDVKEVIILNALGQQVYHKVASTKTININHLQDGIYFVKMITDDNNYLIRKLKVIK